MIPSEFYIFAKARSHRMKQEQEAEQQLTARICSTIANFVPMRTKKGKTYQERDFMPKKKMTPSQMLKSVEKLNKMFGGVDLRKRGTDNE